MSIQASEIKFYKSATVNDTDDNGGVMSDNEITDNVKNNLWPDVPQGERVAGSTKYRKIFIKIANDADLALVDPRIFVETHTPGDDRVLIFPGTQSDTQADIVTPRLYGCGPLDADVSIGATSLAVNTEAAADAIFLSGDLIRVSDKTSVDDANGNEEFIRLAATNAVAWNGNKATLTFDAGQSLANAYTATATRVASVIEHADIQASVDNWVESSAAGTYDETTYPVLPDHIGSVEESWLLTFSSATNFSCVGDRLGSMGSGTIGSSFAPNNAAFSKPYFTLSSSGWGGTWANGDTLAFQTHPATAPVWEKRIVPAGANSLTGNKVVVAISGESA